MSQLLNLSGRVRCILSLIFMFSVLSRVVYSAATKFSEAMRLNYLRNNRAGLAMLNAPVFFFGQESYQPPCIPTWAYQGTPVHPDTFETSNRTKSARRCDFPDVGCDCRKPGVRISTITPAFPIYYTIRQCSDTEFRVTLNLFYEKDGAVCYVDTTHFIRKDVGHDYDWERVVVVYKRNPYTSLWSAEYLLMSQHGGYEGRSWSTIHKTLSTLEARTPDPRRIPFRRGRDHPLIYIGWLKHSHFDFKFTVDVGWPFQLLKWAFRSDDWWQLVGLNDLIEADESTQAGRVMQSQEWGEATSIPPRVNGEVCTIPLRNGLIAVNNSDLAEAAGFRLDDDLHLMNQSSFEAFEKEGG